MGEDETGNSRGAVKFGAKTAEEAETERGRPEGDCRGYEKAVGEGSGRKDEIALSVDFLPDIATALYRKD